MSRIERVTANAGEEFGGGVVFPEAATSCGGVEGEEGGATEGGKVPRVGAGSDPAEVLDAQSGVRIGGGIKPVEDGAEAKVEESDAALAITGGDEEMGGGGLVGEEVAAEGLRGPADGSDEGREKRGGGRRRHGENRNELHRARVNDGDAAAGGEGKEA